jgi:hypothetical protein
MPERSSIGLIFIVRLMRTSRLKHYDCAVVGLKPAIGSSFNGRRPRSNQTVGGCSPERIERRADGDGWDSRENSRGTVDTSL